MIHQSKISQFCLHYGISIVLIAMFVCVISILQAIEINNKVQVEMVYEHDGSVYCYIPKASEGIIRRDSFVLYTEDVSPMTLGIACVESRGAHLICKVVLPTSPVADVLYRERKVTGYILAGKMRLSDLIFHKWADR